jgi:endonuclease I
MKKIISYSVALLCVLGLNAQASLPTSWDMGNATNPISSPPSGWSYNNSSGGNLIYTSSAFYQSAPQAYRIDATGEYLQCYFADKPSKTEFYARHTGSSGSFPGEFQVLESANGTDWDVVKSFTTDMPGSMTLISENLKSSSRYVRYFMKNKPSGFNISIDDASVFKALSGPNREIEVYGGNSEYRVLKNQEAFLGDTNNFKITLVNKSNSQNLKIDSVILSGPGKNYFTLQSIPSSIGFGSSNRETFTIKQGTNGADGSKVAMLTVYSNDQEGNQVFPINLFAIKGARATEPINQPSNLTFTLTKAWRLNLSWTAASSRSRELVLINTKSITDKPEDNESYERGAYIGTSRILFVGEAGEIDINKIVANTNYFVKVFSFDGKNGFENYLNTGAPEINASTPGLAPGNYYTGIDASKNTLISDIRAKINPHFQVYYSNYAPYLVDNFEAYDTTGNRLVLEGYYSGYKHIYTAPLIWNVMSREHCYPYSFMGEASKNTPNYSDLHLLVPVNQNKVNAVRSNFPLGIVKDLTVAFLGGKLGKNASGATVYEPRDQVKGLAARANFYACAAYDEAGKRFTLPTSNQFVGQLQDQWILKKWHKAFPPSNREIARHEYIASVQNNRNPFIDNPDWACKIDFSNMTYLPNGNCDSSSTHNGLGNAITLPIEVYPNPSSGGFMVELPKSFSPDVDVMIYDLFERLVFESNMTERKFELKPNLNPGTYLLLCKSGDTTGIFKIIIN